MIWLSWKKLRWLFASTLIVSVLAAIAFYKPVRILVPKAFGLNCEFEILCIDDTKKLEEAVRLKDEALQFAEVELGVFEQAPKFLFCSTKACFSKFSNPEVAAQYYWGAKIILLNENGWKPYILKHELIHHWQNENLGGVDAAVRLPRWYIEGMAYALSDDPRSAIPNEEANHQRLQFLEWLNVGNDWRIPPK